MKKSISRWYLIQNIIALIIIVVLHLNMPLTIISGIVLSLSIIFYFDFIQSKKLKNINWFIQFFLQPLAVTITWNYVYFELVQYHLNNWLLSTIPSLYYLVMFIPFAFVIAAKARNLFLRLIFTYLQFFSIVLILGNFKSNVLLNSNVIQAIAYLVFIVLVMHLWGAVGPNVKSSKKENIWIIIVLIIITLIFIILNAWNDISSVQQLIGDIFNDKAINFFESIEAGIGEEVTYRYAATVCLLWIFSKSKHRLIFTILGSSLIFGLSHLVNLIQGQALMPTLSQIIFAFSTGLLLMIWYLYTGKLWVTMLFHFVIDWSSTFGTDSMTVESILSSTIKTTPEFIGAFAILIIFSAILIWMMHGKRRQVMEEHAKALMGE